MCTKFEKKILIGFWVIAYTRKFLRRRRDGPESNISPTFVWGYNNKWVISIFKCGYPRLTLKEGPKVKSVHTRRFPAHDFLYVGLPSQTSRTNNKRFISTYNFQIGSPRLILNEGYRVKSIHTRRFPAHDFLYVGLTSQTSRTNNKRVITTYNFAYPCLTLKEGKVKSDHTKRFPAHDFL